VGGTPYSAQALQARLLDWVVHQVTERQGEPPQQITVTCPANWGGFKRDLFDQALKLAGITGATVITEPEAVAILYSSRNALPAGESIAVYDLGGGTFDAAVLRKDPDGFTILGTPDGIEQLGGIDFDEAVFHHTIEALARQVADHAYDTDPDSIAAMTRLRRECVDAKEALSADTETTISVTMPGVTATIRLVRDEFEAMIAPTIADTIRALERTVASAGLTPQDQHSIVLSGGSSRIPLVTHELTKAFGRPIALDTHPKHDVALGAAVFGATQTISAQMASVPPTELVLGPVVPVDDEEQLPPTPDIADIEPTTALPAETDIAPAADDSPPRAVPPAVPPPERPDDPAESAPGTSTSRDRKALIASAAAVVLVGGIAAYVLTRPDDPSAAGSSGPAETVIPQTTTSSSSSEPTTPTAPVFPDNVLVVTSEDPDSGRFTMYQVDTDTGERSRVSEVKSTKTGPRLPVISPDRTTVLYSVGGASIASREIIVQKLGQPDRPLFDASSPCTSAARAAFSPDGSRLAIPCADDGEINGVAVVDLEGHGRRIDVPADVLPNSGGTWTAQNDFIYDAPVAPGADVSTLYSMPVDGSARPEPLDPDDGSSHTGADWNARGGLAYVVSETTEPPGDIAVDPPGAQGPIALTDTGQASHPAWSPDGTHIAYLQDEGNGLHTLWLMDADGDNVRSLSLPGNAGPPAWGSR
jgi:Tol biopolymer transport system component/actin-like ATPase involved in cell morphogenesis